MPGYRFEKFRDPDNVYDVTTVSMTVDTVSLPDMISEFENFLRAVGFVFNGHLEIVEEDEV